MSLDRPTFPTVLLTEGYDLEQVDLAVAMVRDNLELPRPRIDRSEIEGLRFAPVRLRRGYSMSAVDDWLDEVVAELDRRRDEPPVVREREPEPVPEPESEPAPRSQAATDLLQAALIIVLVVGVAVWLYASRF